MKITRQALGAEQASALLDTRGYIRSIRWRKVATYSRDMAEGRWKSISSLIVARTANGGEKLIDGQHRMLALLEANKDNPGITIEFIIISEVEDSPELEDTIDTGMSRQYRDTLSIRGIPNALALAALVRRMYQWDREYFYQGSGNPGGTVPSHAELDIYYRAHQEEVENGVAFGTKRAADIRISPTVLGVAWVVLHRKSPGEADFFLNSLAEVSALRGSSELPDNSPVRTLAQRLLRLDKKEGRQSRSSKSQSDRLALVFIAWKHYRNGTTPSELILPKGPLNNKNFPLPV